MSALKNFKEVLLATPKEHLSQLDFLRFCAIVLVFFSHARQHFLFGSGVASWITDNPIIIGGWIGVDIFFVLSGFLIGGQLWKEYQNIGKINYKKFIIKRSLRIWPLFYTLLIVFLIYRGPLDKNWKYSDFYFLSNYFEEGGIKGSWSLSIEEQFYILIPIIFLLLTKFKLGLREGRWLCVVFFMLSPLIRYFNWKYITSYNLESVQLEIKHIYFPFHTHMDGLILGVLLSNIYVDKKLKNILNWKVVTLILFFLTLCFFVLRLKFRIYFNYSFFSCFFALTLWVILHVENFINKIFSLPIFSLVAKLSFGIYLVHREIMDQATLGVVKIGQSLPPAIHFIMYSSIMFFICIVISSLAYKFIEWPALRHRASLIRD